MQKVKIVNDPVHGFISIPKGPIFEIMEHPYFQRLRRIKQLGLTHLVYPGALHTRFHHALGAFHLTSNAMDTLRQKGIDISDEEREAVSLAILLHDIGHGPFSHSLERSIVKNIDHEQMSLLIMDRLNEQFNGALTLAIRIFNDRYQRKFLHELVSSQLDMDRLDYLARDSFFTGVSEGIIGIERIIKMVNVHRGKLAVESKGIYSIEKFLVARRIMYWQVYLHKTVISAEQLLIRILARAREVAKSGKNIFSTPVFRTFLYETCTLNDIRENPDLLKDFTHLDDDDISISVKCWQNSEDRVLASLCKMLINRQLLKLNFYTEPFDKEKLELLKIEFARKENISVEEAGYYIFSDSVKNAAYEEAADTGIMILQKNGQVHDIAKASDNYNISALSKTVEKYFLCFPESIQPYLMKIHHH